MAANRVPPTPTLAVSQLTVLVLHDVAVERGRQEAKCREQRELGVDGWRTCADPQLPDDARLAVLVEEVGEVARELCERRIGNGDTQRLRTELVQLAAVAVAWIEGIDA